MAINTVDNWCIVWRCSSQILVIALIYKIGSSHRTEWFIITKWMAGKRNDIFFHLIFRMKSEFPIDWRQIYYLPIPTKRTKTVVFMINWTKFESLTALILHLCSFHFPRSTRSSGAECCSSGQRFHEYLTHLIFQLWKN